MNAFSESFQKELGKGIAQLLLGVTTFLLLVAAGLLQGDKHSASTILLYLSALASLVLCVSLVFRLLSYRKMYRKILDLESRFNVAEAEKLAERTRMARDMYEIELMNKTTPRKKHG